MHEPTIEELLDRAVQALTVVTELLRRSSRRRSWPSIAAILMPRTYSPRRPDATNFED